MTNGNPVVEWLRENRGYDTPCWIWQRGKTQAGYGRIGKSDYSHRVFYERFKGPIPEGLEIDHLCRQRDCCNPEHLEAVTRVVNSRRGDKTVLAPEDVELIRASTKTHAALGRRFGVSARHVSMIRAGTRWAA